MLPTVGRVVYYKSRGSADGKYASVDRAAIVTDVKPDTRNVIRLCVLSPEGMFFTDWLEKGDEGGEWNWMPFQKDQQARMAEGTKNDSHPPAEAEVAEEAKEA